MSNQYACLNTKIMAMRGSTLKAEEYSKMIVAPDVSEVYEIIRSQTVYGDDFFDFDVSGGIHRQEIEWRLKRYQVRQAEKFFFYLKGYEKKLMSTLLMPLEIAALSQCVRSLAAGKNIQALLPTLVWSRRVATVDFNHLTKAEDWEDFKYRLKKTPYYRLLEIYPEISDKGTLFQIEKTIERYYFDLLNQILSHYKGKENRLMVETLRREIDLVNLVWIYRGKFYYGLSRETLIAFALMGGMAFSPAKLLQLIEADDLTAFIQIVDTVPDYLFLFHHGKTLDLYMERRKSRFLYYAYKKLFKQSGGIGRAVAFFRISGFDIQDIISIIESKRYGLSEEACEAFLIRDLN